jgi:hypothetical protein
MAAGSSFGMELSVSAFAATGVSDDRGVAVTSLA